MWPGASRCTSTGIGSPTQEALSGFDKLVQVWSSTSISRTDPPDGERPPSPVSAAAKISATVDAGCAGAEAEAEPGGT